MELRERVIAVLRTTELWRDMDGIGTLDTYGPADSDYAKLADAAIAAVLDALQEPSEAVRSIGQQCEAVGCDGGEIFKAMLAAFRTEALPPDSRGGR